MIQTMGRKQREVRPDGRVVVGLVVGAMTSGLLARGVNHHPASGFVVGLASGVVCVAGYLAWFYGRDWYERKAVARHTYRPEDH